MIKRYRILGALLFSLLALALVPQWNQIASAQQFGTGFLGQYFNNPDFAGSPVISQQDAAINFAYGEGSPLPGFLPENNFSIRWQGLQTLAPGTYRFTLVADDGARLVINGQEVINFLGNVGTQRAETADVVIADGVADITVEYIEREGNAVVQFFWDPFNVGPTPTTGPTPTPTATGLPPIPPGALTATVIRASVLNVRDAPSLGGNVINRILRGQTYAVIGRDASARWFLLQLNNQVGWAWGYYLFIDGNEFNPPITSAAGSIGLPPGVQDTGVIVQARAGLRLRAEPNVVSAQTGRIVWGSFLPVIGRTAAGDWYQVVWKGTVGWAASGFLRIFQGDLNNVPIVQ